MLVQWSPTANCVVPSFLVQHSAYLSLLAEEGATSLRIPDETMRTVFGSVMTDDIVLLAFRYLEGIYGCSRRYNNASAWENVVNKSVQLRKSLPMLWAFQKTCDYFTGDIASNQLVHVLAFVTFLGFERPGYNDGGSGSHVTLCLHNPAELFLAYHLAYIVTINPHAVSGLNGDRVEQFLGLTTKK